jgi:hypothetical protein
VKSKVTGQFHVNWPAQAKVSLKVAAAKRGVTSSALLLEAFTAYTRNGKAHALPITEQPIVAPAQLQEPDLSEDWKPSSIEVPEGWEGDDVLTRQAASLLDVPSRPQETWSAWRARIQAELNKRNGGNA